MSAQCNGVKPNCKNCEKAEVQCEYRHCRRSRYPEEEEIFNRLRDSEKNQQVQSEVINLLRSLPLDKATQMLQHLRNNSDLPTAISSIQQSSSLTARPSDLRVARAVASPTGSATEFELTAQFSAAYPRLPPPDLQALRELLWQGNNSNAAPAFNRVLGLLPPTSQDSSQTATPSASDEYCDSRLQSLQISYWTKIPVSDEMAASLISFYIETDHNILGLFDADLFLQDLVEFRQRFCSSFLVSAILCYACVGIPLNSYYTTCMLKAAAKLHSHQTSNERNTSCRF